MSTTFTGEAGLEKPKTELMPPREASVDMLADVQVDTEGQRLWTPGPVGTVGRISLELYGIGLEGENRFGFYSPLSPSFDPDAEENPNPTHQYPYAILPDGTQYELVIRAPLDMIDTAWSKGEQVPIIESGSIKGLGGLSKREFKKMYPNVDVSELEDEFYKVTATERTLSTLLVLGRVANGEPLARIMAESNGEVVYREIPAGFARRSALQPETAVAQIDSRLTVSGEGATAGDQQNLVFRVDDGFQRTDDGGNRGLIELIVAQATLVNHSDFRFQPYRFNIAPTYDPLDSFSRSRGGGVKLASGETRYSAPQRVQVSSVGIRKNMKPIAAFRFALVGETLND